LPPLQCAAAVFAVLQGRATAATGGGVVNKRRATARDSESFVEERAMSGDRAPVYLATVATPGCGAAAPWPGHAVDR